MFASFKKINREYLIYGIIIIVFALSMTFITEMFLLYMMIALVWSYLVILRKKVTIGIGDALIFMAMLAYMWTWTYEFWEGVAFALKITSVYQVGKYLSEPEFYGSGDAEHSLGSNTGKFAFVVILILASVLLSLGLLNYSYILLHPEVMPTASWPSWLNPEIVDLKTHYEFYLIIWGSLLTFWLILFKQTKTAGAIVGAMISLFSVILGVYGLGRLTFGCTVGTMALVLALVLIDNKAYKNRWIWIVVGIFTLVAVALHMGIQFNVVGMGDLYADSNWSRGGGILHNVRFTIFRKAILLIIEHPFGHYDDLIWQWYYAAHNSWLDIALRGGVISFILMVCFTVSNIVSMFMVWVKDKSVYRYALICAFIGMTLYNCFETPVTFNSATYMCWSVEVFLGGLVNGRSESLLGKRGLTLRLEDSV